MSYIIEPNYEAGRAITNRINEKTRHCRIGKVAFKTGVPWVDKGIVPFDRMKPQPVIPGDIHNGFIPWWQRGPWCGTQSGGYVPVTKTNDIPLVPSHGVMM